MTRNSRAIVAVFLAAAALTGCRSADSDGDASQASGDLMEATQGTSLVRFASPADGATVPATFGVEMAAEGITIEPAGEIRDNSGHFHIVIDAPFVDAGQVIPTDENHLHFGTGATSAEITLSPGQHTLRLQVANGAHIAYDAATHGHQIVVNVEDTE